MSRILTLAYGVVSYLIFFLTFLYAIGFLGNVVVPKSLDSGPTDPWLTALTIDLALLSVFAVQHSVMARQGFKRFVNRLIPEGTERSTYVLASSLALILLFWQWRPLGGVIWDVQHPAGRALLYGGFAFGWLLVLGATVAINHFDLFGSASVVAGLSRTAAGRASVRDAGSLSPGSSPALRRLVLRLLEHTDDDRDAPVFACVTTAYILVAIQLEERDLMNAHPEYAEYRRRVPMLVPALRSNHAQTEAVRAGRA